MKTDLSQPISLSSSLFHKRESDCSMNSQNVVDHGGHSESNTVLLDAGIEITKSQQANTCAMSLISYADTLHNGFSDSSFLCVAKMLAV